VRDYLNSNEEGKTGLTSVCSVRLGPPAPGSTPPTASQLKNASICSGLSFGVQP